MRDACPLTPAESADLARLLDRAESLTPAAPFRLGPHRLVCDRALWLGQLRRRAGAGWLERRSAYADLRLLETLSGDKGADV